MFMCLLIYVLRGKAKVYYIYLQGLKKVVVAAHQVLCICSKIEQKVIKFEIIVYKACIMNLLKNVKNLES